MLTLPQPFTFPPLSRTDLVRYAGASGDFNPLHHDHAFAANAGLPDVMAHGMLTAGLLATALTGWFGQENVTRYVVRFLSPVWPGDRLTAHCIRLISTVDDPSCAELLVEMIRSADDIVLSGSARIRKPWNENIEDKS